MTRRLMVTALLTLTLAVWGHDAGTAAASLLAPRPETFKQLFDRP